jgi:hypothetical protein
MLAPRRPIRKIPFHPRQEAPLPRRVTLPLKCLDPPPPHRTGQNAQVAGPLACANAASSSASYCVTTSGTALAASTTRVAASVSTGMPTTGGSCC